jgi:4-hydroxy-tetrahydrodipicolinate reductase
MPGIAIFGITGRMGQSLVRALGEGVAGLGAAPVADSLVLSGALASASSSRLGEDAALAGTSTGIKITADVHTALAGARVAADFSLPLGVADHVRECRARGVPLLVGTTGLDAATRDALAAAARDIPVLIAPNTSLGVAVLNHLAGIAAGALGEGYEVEIAEAHHRMKRDAPSGTALALGDAVARARGKDLDSLAVYGRGGSGARKAGSIGFSVVRAGDIVGEHTVLLAGEGERLELTHRATDRMVFARGALRAAAWLIGRPAGTYGMADVLGLTVG